MEKAKEQRKKIVIFYSESDRDKDEYNEIYNEFTNKINSLNNKISELSKSNNQIIEEVQIIDGAIKSIDNFQLKDKYTKNELLNSIKNIIINRDGTVGINYNISSQIDYILEKYHPNVNFNKAFEWYMGWTNITDGLISSSRK